MDKRVLNTIQYAKEELDEISQLVEEGKLTEKGVFVRMFSLGKVLLGWDDEGPLSEQIAYLTKTNEWVQSLLDEASRYTSS